MLTDVNFELEKNLEHGANFHQIAQLYRAQTQLEYEVLSDKQLSYNDIMDLKIALDLTSEFYDVNAAVIVKLGMPCAVALGSDCLEAVQKAIDCDPISIFNSTIMFSGTVDENIASLIRKLEFNALVALDYTDKALEMLKNTSKIVRVKTPLDRYKKFENIEINMTPLGALVQSQDKKELDKDSFNVVSKTKPTAEMVEDAVFAWKVAKHAKSQAVVIAKDFKTLAICQGNTNMVNAVERALDFACNESKDAILATDGQIHSVESINAAVQGRVGVIIQTGGDSKNIIDAADKYNIVMINTGISHIKY